MSGIDFPLWYSIGSYGGLVCTLVAATSIATYALLRRRGTPRQLARATLTCLIAGTLMLAAIWWKQNRLDLYGPTLSALQVLFWLTWTALCGWCVPVGMLVGYVVLAAPLATTASGRMTVIAPPTVRDQSPLSATINDPERQIEPFSDGAAWGRLIPLNGPFAEQPIALTRQLTLLGRELDNDIVVDDERTSRHHAEIRWDHGRVQLRDGNSMNGTLLNRQAVRGPVLLKSGDMLELGAQRYRFESLMSQPVAQTPSSGGDEAPLDATIRDATIEESDTRKMPGASNGSSVLPPLPIALVGDTGIVTGKRWMVDTALVTIGREPDRDICLPDPSVSRLHAQIVRQRDGYFITDLRSSNGTFLNERQLTAPALLSPNDVLRIGEFVLRCERATDAPTASPQAPDSEAANNISDATTPPSSSTTHALDRRSVQATVE
ncbi:MAG TPA: FHA domain-containing protein [Ktedonobacterales bacterium]